MSSRISRRKYLRLTGTAVAGGITGCTAFSGHNEEVAVCDVELFNEDSTSHSVYINIEADGDSIHEGNSDVSGATEETVADREFDSRTWFDGPVNRLTLEGRVDDSETVGPVDLTASELPERTEIIYHVQDDGSLSIKHSATGSGSC